MSQRMAAARLGAVCDAQGMADVETITDTTAALDRCGDLFRTDPVGSNMPATMLVPTAEVEVFRAHEGAETSGVAVVAAGSCLLTPCAPGSAESLAAAMSIEGPIEVSGPAGPVAAVAGVFAERLDGAVAQPRLSRVYRTDAVVEPSKRRRGKAFVSTTDRLEQAVAWAMEFDAERAADVVQAQMERALNEHRLVEWRSKGEVVAQLLVSAVRFGVVRISQVHTDAEHRGKGHGAAFVAAVAQQQLDRQKVDTVVINAQSENATTNRMYRALGFDAAVELLTVRVVAG